MIGHGQFGRNDPRLDGGTLVDGRLG